MSYTRYCKCHFHEGESEHWGLLDRKAFAHKGAISHYTPDIQVSPEHLILDVNFDWVTERVWGTTHYNLIFKGHNVEEISFDAVNLDVSRVVIGRKLVHFENTGKKIIVQLNKQYKLGDRISIKLDHSVTRPVAGVYFTKPDNHHIDRFKTVWTQGQDEDSRYYFPCFDKPNFKQTTEVIMHLPPKMFGLSNGRLVKKKLSQAGSLFHYKMELPYSTYLLSIVAGEFSEHQETVKGVNIKWYVQKGREREGRNAFKDTGKIIQFFSNYTGFQYPYKHYTQIAVPEFVFGGMENFTVTTQTDLALFDDRAALDGDSNGLVAHEAAHTWFGNIVTAKNWSHAWLHESFATYFDALYTRESKGENEFRYQLLENAETYFSEDSSYRRPIVTNLYKEPIDLFDAHLYPGGAVRLHHLKSIVGEKHFREALEKFLNRHRYDLVETTDFIRCIEEVTGCNYDEWLQQWIYRGGYPRLELTFDWNASGKIATIGIKQTQKADNKNEELLFKIPFVLAFYYKNSEERFSIEIKSDKEKFCFRLKNKPLFFRIDPDYECPCKVVVSDIPRPMFYEQIKRDPDPIGRLEAAMALSKNSSSEDVSVLGERLKKEKEWGVSIRISKALGKVGGKEARNFLIKGLKISDPKIRRGIVSALGSFPHDEKSILALRECAKNDPSYRVEANALQMLGKVKDKDSFSFLESSISRPSHNAMAQTGIYNALAELEDEASWDYLIRGAEYGAHRNSRQAAMRALAKLANRFPHRKGEVIEHLTRFAHEKRGTPAATFRGKLGAIMAMKQLDDLLAIPILRQIIENETDGRLQRRAEDTISYLRESAKKPKEIKDIRFELDAVIAENKSLRERMDLIEKKQEAKNRKKKG